MTMINPEPLTRDAFAPFGQVIEPEGEHFPINGGRGQRYHDLARIELAGLHPRPLISIVRSQPAALPYSFSMVERHPLGSQAFHPLTPNRFLVVVAPDEGGTPGTPRAFLTSPGQGINYAINTWHGVLTPLGEASDFLVIDRGGEGQNLEEFHYGAPFTVVALG